MDNPTTESSLTPADAASIFANLDTPVEAPSKEDKVETEIVEAVEEAVEVESEETQEEDPIVTVKIDGKDVEVKLSELKNGYSRNADYTRKMQAVAEQRRTADADIQKAQQERQTYANNLQRLQIQTEAALQERQGIDWAALLKSDPVEYLEQRRIAEEQQAKLAQIYGEQDNVQQQDAQELKQRQAVFLADQRDQLLAKIPAWKDEAKAKTEKAALRDFLVTEGYEPEMIDNLADSRYVVTARKAYLYDQMMAKASAAAKKVSTLPTRVERPGTGESQSLDKRSSAFQRLSKSGRVEDAGALFSSLI